MAKRKQPAKKKKKKEEKPTGGHPLRGEIRGIVLVLITILLAGSLLSYHPADRLLRLAGDPSLQTQNLFGTVGAHIAGGAFGLFGFSGFWLILISTALAILSFRGRPVPSPLASIAAALVLVVSFAMLLDLWLSAELPFRFRGRPIPAGGVVGAYLAYHGSDLLNRFGAYVLGVAFFLISLMVATRLSLGWLFSLLGRTIWGVIRRIRETRRKRQERTRRARRTQAARKQVRTRPKVKITPPPPKPKKKPKQELLPFMNVSGKYQLPSLDLLTDPPPKQDGALHKESLEMNARRLEKKLSDFGVQGQVLEISPGPVITMYEFKPAPGIKISKVAGLSDDLALALRAAGIRIVAPIPGKAAIGIEIPNNQREFVVLKEILASPAYRESTHRLPIALGHDITGLPVVADLAKMPHLLVAGATGSGKSASINTMLHSILFKLSPDQVRLLLVDPKRIELSAYRDIPHLLHPVVTNPKDANQALRWAVAEMERRYMLLSDRGVRNIEGFNRKIAKEKTADPESATQPLPYIIVIIDELADLMMASSREVEESITRLAQMARAAGIHLIIATQRPSVDVLTGIIKANIPRRISFQVSSRVDSRTILDAMGAEQLLGQGDMLFMTPGVGRIMRIHGAYVSEEEIRRVTEFLRAQRPPEYDPTVVAPTPDGAEGEDDLERDEKYDQAVQVVLKTGQASISMLQRRLRVGYNRSARMIELMEREGIVGASDGVRPREVLGRKDEG